MARFATKNFSERRLGEVHPRSELSDDSPERAESNISRNFPYFYVHGSAEDVEAEAEKFIAKAEEYEERIARLRAVL